MSQFLRTRIRSVLSWFGFGVYKINSPEIINFWNLLFLVMKEEGHVRYLQIGANDGVLVDPMYEFVCENQERVSGLLVEPVEIYYQKLKNNYAKFRNITAVRRGIHNFENSMTIFVAKVTGNHHQKIAVAGLSSFNKGHLLKNTSVVESDIVEEQVQCSSVEELLQEFGFNDINVLVIDTEGYDFEILDKLDFYKVSPKIVLFEHGLGGGTMTPSELDTLCEKFNEFGYQVTIVNNDAIAIQTQFMVKCLLQLESHPDLDI